MANPFLTGSLWSNAKFRDYKATRFYFLCTSGTNYWSLLKKKKKKRYQLTQEKGSKNEMPGFPPTYSVCFQINKKIKYLLYSLNTLSGVTS